MHCSTHLKKKKILFHFLIKIIQTYLILLFFYSFFHSKTCRAPAKPLKPFFFFFHHLIKLSHLSHQALISHQAHHLSNLSHQPSSLIKLSSPLKTKAKDAAVAIPSPSRRRPTSSTLNSHLSASPLSAHPRPWPTPLKQAADLSWSLCSDLVVTDPLQRAPPPCSPRRPSPRPSMSPAHFRSVLSLHF